MRVMLEPVSKMASVNMLLILMAMKKGDEAKDG
jgi:hypothetical protein